MELMNLYQQLVHHFGSQKATAIALKCKQPSVNAWVAGKARMSAVVATRAEVATNSHFKAADLCPDLKQALAKTA